MNEETCNAKGSVHHWNKEIPLCPVCCKKDLEDVTTVEEIYTIMNQEVPTVLDVGTQHSNTLHELKKDFDRIKSLKKIK